jgi:hypothetical protein
LYINLVLSSLGAWQKLQTDFSDTLREIEQALMTVEFPEDDQRPYRFGRRDMDKAFKAGFLSRGWKAPGEVSVNAKYWWYDAGFTKGGISVEYNHLGHKDVINTPFVQGPVLVDTGALQMIIILAPTSDVRFRKHTQQFGYVVNYLKDLSSISLKYPFAIFGVSSVQRSIKVEELTSPLDLFLVESTGLALGEMAMHSERERYDFKESLPENRTIYHLACALANQRHGRVMLFGVNNAGNIVGLPRSELDNAKLRISETVKRNCKPSPILSMADFDSPFDTDKCVLIVRVVEVDRKPCMADEKVYIRVDSSSQPAETDDIRRLVLETTN